MTERESIPTHPVQTRTSYPRESARCPTVVTLRAYEVYAVVFGEQKALITGDCRGGFGTGELIALLYARTFPREEWYLRFKEAINGAKNL